MECVILAEDAHSAKLLRKYAERLVEKRRIRVLPLVGSQGSGEQFVRLQFAREVKEYRRSRPLKTCVLLVHLDADLLTYKKRLEQLDAELRENGQESRQPKERITIITPKRKVETWIYFLNGLPADEEYDFKRDPDGRIPAAEKRSLDAQISPACAKLYQLTRDNAEPAALPTLRDGVRELRRMEDKFA